jgi:signal transduction histidine kinase
MKDKNSPHLQIVKGQPIFRRHLYISSVLFVIIILITTLILVRLAMDSLEDRVNTEMINIGEDYAHQIRDQIQRVNSRGDASEGAYEFRRNAEIENDIDGLLAGQEEILYIFIQSLDGEILWKGFRRGMELEQNQFSKVLISPKNSRPPKVVLSSLSNPRSQYTDLIVPVLLDDQSQLIMHLAFDNALMERRFTQFRSHILNRILLASSIVVAILTLALSYVLWLLKRAQWVEAEAHTADRLAYLGTLASGLAHEIRNPLSAMNLNLQMIEEEISPADGSELRTLLKGTKQEIERLNRLATNFLFYAKPLDLEKRMIPVPDLLEDVALLVSQECEKSGIRLVTQNGSGPLSIQADRDLLKQAVLNLIVNAQEAVKSKPADNRRITLEAAREGDQVVIRVRDTGPGVGPEEARNLFKLFYSSKRGGSGLGLPIAQRIVESHGGKIEWRNLDQEGAEFVIRLSL